MLTLSSSLNNSTLPMNKNNNIIRSNKNKNNDGGSFVMEAGQQGTSGRMRSLIAILDAALDIVDHYDDDDDGDHGAGATTSSKNTCWSSFRRPKL